jgi:L-arabinose isomerase
LEIFLNKYARAGGSHHQALGYGHVADILGILAEYSGIDFLKL